MLAVRLPRLLPAADLVRADDLLRHDDGRRALRAARPVQHRVPGDPAGGDGDRCGRRGGRGAVRAAHPHPRRRRREQADAFLTPLAELLRDAADDLRAGPEVRPLAAAARDVDDRMHALLASASPLGQLPVRRRPGPLRAVAAAGDGRARRPRAGSPAWSGPPPRPPTRTPATGSRSWPPPSPTWPQAVADAGADRRPGGRACEQEGTLVDLVEAVHAGPTVAAGGDPRARPAARGAGRRVARVRAAGPGPAPALRPAA